MGLIYTPNICIGGTPIESSESGSLYTAAKAFDGDVNTYWQALETGAGANGVSYCGYTHTKPRHVRLLVISYGAFANYIPISQKLQGWNGFVWVDILTFAPFVNGIYTYQTIQVPSNAAFTKHRILANAALTGAFAMCIAELKMMEASYTSFVGLLISPRQLHKL